MTTTTRHGNDNSYTTKTTRHDIDNSSTTSTTTTTHGINNTA